MVVQGVVAAARPAHHLTQVAREIGIPVIGHIGPAITHIGEGALLHLDAEHGTVRIE
jgi:phosphohistidine swiveling domain-containing protein